MTRLYLVRHGNTFESTEPPRYVGARSDLPLTKKGVQQLAELGSALNGPTLAPTVMVCGPLLRHRQSADAIASRISAPIEIVYDPALNEIDYGVWEGLTEEEIGVRWPDELEQWRLQGIWPKEIFGETLDSLSVRIRVWLDAMSAIHADNVLAVTSNGVIRIVRSVIEGTSPSFLAPELKVRTGSISVIECRNGSWGLRLWDSKPQDKSFFDWSAG